MELNYTVNNDKYFNINQILKNEFNISKRLMTKLVKNKKILLNGKSIDTRNSIKLNDKISILLDLEEDNSNIEPTEINLDITYEDESMLIINKPAGIAVHPSIEHYSDTLSNGVRYYFDKKHINKKIRPVNRLDLNTSGLVIFAKNEYIQECLIQQMSYKKFKKEYIAIVEGTFAIKNGTIDLPIARKENSIIERCIDENGKPSITHYEVLKEFNNYSIIRCILETGRTHQIRLHMSYINHPLLGDTLYGNPSNIISRQALHCHKLSFIHPINKKNMEIVSLFPSDINKLIK